MKTTILIHCPDRPGIVHAVTGFLHSKGANIVYLDQHVDQQSNVFFMRLESDFGETAMAMDAFAREFSELLAVPYRMQWSMHLASTRPKMALFVSKYNHCLYDLLSRYNSGELNVDVPFILSNHPDLEPIADQFGIPFYHVEVTRQNKTEAEAEQLRLLKDHEVDFIVLARYMQIIGKRMIDQYPNKIINIHHSFLPAFTGAKPYHAAFKRGVKIIGATSHYVTEELDEGPIIAQDVARVSHAHSIGDFIAMGRDLEKIVLSRAVKLHVERKTIVYDNKTVVFS